MAECKTIRGWFNRWFHGEKDAKSRAFRELGRVVERERAAERALEVWYDLTEIRNFLVRAHNGLSGAVYDPKLLDDLAAEAKRLAEEIER